MLCENQVSISRRNHGKRSLLQVDY
jgi:hypothetical protein